jgi:hypothetical protein
MPAGLTHSLRRDELIDLVRFLSELGKEGDYKVQEDGTLRQWFVHGDASLKSPAPLMTLVNGKIPTSEMPVIEFEGKRTRMVESKFEVIKDGEFLLELTDATEAQCEINGEKVSPKQGKLNIALKKGNHTLRLTVSEASKAMPRVRLNSTNATPIH